MNDFEEMNKKFKAYREKEKENYRNIESDLDKFRREYSKRTAAISNSRGLINKGR